MAVTVVVGTQWGDEGKGKVIDFLSKTADYIVRFNGGNNAGHTIINEHGKFAMHLIPSGIFQKKAICLIANGVAIDLPTLLTEISDLEKADIQTKGKLFLSPRCHLIMPYHKLLDAAYEQAKGKAKTGTTGRGIGPVYADKVSYNGIRIFDLLNKKQFEEKLHVQLLVKNKILKALGVTPLNEKEIAKTYLTYLAQIKPYIQEPQPILQKAIAQKKSVLFEGAQGVFLDNDWGTYPFATASTVITGGINHGAGIPVSKVTSTLGVVKAYTTRVGAGPFPTELFDKTGELLQKEGNEFGATTGRPRRCGWFDAELIKTAAALCGLTHLVITKLDILDTFPAINIATHYEYKGGKVSYIDCDAELLSKIKPVYKTVKGWKTSTKGVTNYKKLPKEAKAYLKEIEKVVGVPITYISTGQKTNEIIKV